MLSALPNFCLLNTLLPYLPYKLPIFQTSVVLPRRLLHFATRMQKYTPDSRLNDISPIPTRFDKRKMLPDTGTALEFSWARIPTFPVYKRPMGKRIMAIYALSTTLGFAAAWFGAATFDHINLKIDSFRDRLDIIPYK